MKSLSKGAVVYIFFIIAAVLALGCSPGFVSPGKETSPQTGSAPTAAANTLPKPTNELTQSHDGGSVTIDLTWRGEVNSSLTFNVAMNTHSVDLDQYDLGKLAVLRDDTAKEYRPTFWNAPTGGHHRSGTLTFPIPDSLSQKNAKFVEVVIRDIAGINERVLRWEL